MHAKTSFWCGAVQALLKAHTGRQHPCMTGMRNLSCHSDAVVQAQYNVLWALSVRLGYYTARLCCSSRAYIALPHLSLMALTQAGSSVTMRSW